MKKLFTLMAVAGMALTVNAQSVSISKVEQGLANDYAAGCEIDIDNDGVKEIIVGGSPNWMNIGTVITDAEGNEVQIDSRATWILKYNGSNYTSTQLSDKGVFGIRSHCIPADFNGDGNVDFYIASGGDANTLNGIFLNDGNGKFTRDDSFKVIDEEGNPIVDAENGELRWLPRAIDVADFNCDGLPDIVSCGWWLTKDAEGWQNFTMNGVLINNGDGTFKLTCRDLISDDNDVISMALCTIKAYDLNNDGYADFMVQGNVDNPNPVEGRATRVYMNLGADTDTSESPVAFYSLGIEDGTTHNYGNGNFVVADFNCDGTPDIFITGECPQDAGTLGLPEQYSYWGHLLKSKITKTVDGNDVQYTDDMSFVARGKDIRPLNSNNMGVRGIDYNGDGYYDLFLLGWTTQMLDGSGNTQSGWFLPGSAAGLTSYQRIPGASEQGIFFLDYGVEGALNYTFTGYHGDATYFADESEFPMGRSMVFTKNPWNVAARPDAPTAPKAEVDGNTVKLSWTAAASSMKNVTYEYYLKEKTTGKIYNGATSFIGGDKDGVRKVLREGNAYMNTELTLTLPNGTFEWGVQTVNAALRGSVFAKGQDIVVGDGQFQSISNVKAATAEQTIYSLDGKRLAGMQKGVNIVKMSDGNVKKVVK